MIVIAEVKWPFCKPKNGNRIYVLLFYSIPSLLPFVLSPSYIARSCTANYYLFKHKLQSPLGWETVYANYVFANEEM